jgi:hypothetical protein
MMSPVSRTLRVAWLVAAALVAVADRGWAETRYALIVSGAAGGEEYVEQYARLTASLSKTLTGRMKFDPALITVLSDTVRAPSAATAENVGRVFGSIRARMTKDDLLLVFLIGHGTFDGVDAKFNLVGPDLESADWAALIRPLPGRVVTINTSSASFPFLERLTGPRRIVITSTDSAVQSFDTVFADYFIRALTDEAADIDKNGRISVWEAFVAASRAVGRHYQQRGQLATERALIDDNGDGIGKEAADQGDDGSYASRTYLDESLPGVAPTDDVLLKLLQRKATLESDVEDLKIRRTFLQPAEYTQEFERLMVELARVSHDIRARAKS